MHVIYEILQWMSIQAKRQMQTVTYFKAQKRQKQHSLLTDVINDGKMENIAYEDSR